MHSPFYHSMFDLKIPSLDGLNFDGLTISLLSVSPLIRRCEDSATKIQAHARSVLVRGPGSLGVALIG